MRTVVDSRFARQLRRSVWPRHRRAGFYGLPILLEERGTPRVVGERAAAPGLRFIGYVPRPGGLGHMAREVKRAATAIERELAPGPGAGAR